MKAVKKDEISNLNRSKTSSKIEAVIGSLKNETKQNKTQPEGFSTKFYRRSKKSSCQYLSNYSTM